MINDGDKHFIIRQINHAREWLEKALGNYENLDDAKGFMDLTLAEAEIRSAREKSAGLAVQEPRPMPTRQRARIAQVSVASLVAVGFIAGLVYTRIQSAPRPGPAELGGPEATISAPAPEIRADALSPLPTEVAEPVAEPVKPLVEVVIEEPAAEAAATPPAPTPTRVQPAAPRPAPRPGSAARPGPEPAAVTPRPEPAVAPEPEPATAEPHSDNQAYIMSLEEYSALRDAALRARDGVE